MAGKLWTFLLFLGISRTTLALEKGVYHIINLFDGSVLESRFEFDIVGGNYTKNFVITNDLKCGAEEQLWEVERFECPNCRKSLTFEGYVLVNRKTKQNEISIVRPDNSTTGKPHRYELIPVPTNGNNVFKIQSKENNNCLVNSDNSEDQGTERRIGWSLKCESSSANQLWKFHPISENLENIKSN